MKSTLSFNDLVQRRMFLLVLAIFLLSTSFSFGNGLRGVNYVVSPSFDPIGYALKKVISNLWLVFIVGYAIVGLFRFRTGIVFSKIHLFAVLAEITLDELPYYIDWLVHLILVISILSFLANIIYAFVTRKRDLKLTL